jgi:DNA modification methylase
LKLLQGDCLEHLKTLPDNSIDLVLTDPPYGLSFMGKKWDYDVPKVEVWQECIRVLKPGGHLLAFAGTRTQHRMAVRIEDAGFEIRDMIAWVYGSGFPKSHNVSKSLDLMARNEWLNVSKLLDNLNISGIIEMWKNASNSVSFAENLSQKNQIEIGINTQKNDSAQENVLHQNAQKNLPLNAIIAELILSEARHTQEAQASIVQSNAEATTIQSQSPVILVERLLENQNVTESIIIGIAQWLVRELPSAKMANNHRDDEALKIWLGKKKSLSSADINVLCVALTENLKHIILNQSKIFQNLDTKSQTECVSAITVTTTRYTAECLILFTVNTLKNFAIDKAAGAEREVVGTKPSLHRGVSADHKYGFSVNEQINITAPATPEAKEWEGWGSSLKPALEPLTLARKPLEGTIAENVLKWGTGALNVDAARVETDESLQRPERRGLGQTGGWANYSQTPGMYGTPQGQGRFPANLIHDGSDEVLALFPETKSGSRKAGQYTIAAGHGRYGEYGEGEMPEIEGSSGSAARFFYCAKASKSERGEANNHPTVKPIKLMEYLVKLASREGAVILDPYLGSGTTGIACRNLNRQFIGIELDPAYFEIARKRIEGIFQEVA